MLRTCGEEEDLTPVVPRSPAARTKIDHHALGGVDFIQRGPAIGTIHGARPSGAGERATWWRVCNFYTHLPPPENAPHLRA